MNRLGKALPASLAPVWGIMRQRGPGGGERLAEQWGCSGDSWSKVRERALTPEVTAGGAQGTEPCCWGGKAPYVGTQDFPQVPNN